MKSIIKSVCIGIGSFVSGVVVGFYGTRNYMEKRINDVVKEECDKILKGNKEPIDPPKTPEGVTLINVKELERETPVWEQAKEDKKTAAEIVKKNAYDTAIDVDDLYKDYKVPEVGHVNKKDAIKEVPEVHLGNKNGIDVHLVGPFRDGTVYIIDEEEYDESPEYTKTAYTYFAEDDTFYDEGDEPIDAEDVPGLLGSNILNTFGILSDDPDIVHVRNKNRNLNIEVARVRGSHDDD